MQVPESIQTAIQEKLSAHFPPPDSFHFSAIGGGSINETFRISFGSENVFCKVNSASRYPQLFEKEKKGLSLIGEQNLIKTPAVIESFQEGDAQILLLEWIDSGERTDTFWKSFGEGLAALHHATSNSFGLHEDNYMGSVSQSNRQHKNWNRFFAAERLQPMVQRCSQKGLLSKTHVQQFENLEQRLAQIFEEEQPSLLHGDLWSGNFMCNKMGEPFLIDPAVYFGHRSVDLAITTLFGGFRSPFYEAYHYHFPLPNNYEEQWVVCNLYPLLIHLYLFGKSYLPQIERTLRCFT